MSNSDNEYQGGSANIVYSGYTCGSCGVWVSARSSHSCPTAVSSGFTLSGYSCPICSIWVTPGTLHSCVNYYQGVPRADWQILQELKRIASALEKLSNIQLDEDGRVLVNPQATPGTKDASQCQPSIKPLSPLPNSWQ